MNNLIMLHIYLIIMYLIYKYLYSNSTHFVANRIFLWLIAPGAILLAYIPRLFHSGQMFAKVMLPAFVIHPGHSILPDILAEETDHFHILKIIYFSVAAILFFRLLWRHFRLISSLQTEKIEKQEGIYIIRDSGVRAPYSYFRYLMLPAETAGTEAEKLMIAHEKAHIIQRHSLDILWFNILAAFMWINPVSWLIIKEMKKIHEYLADQNTIAGMPDKRAYYQLLFSQYLNISPIGFINTFSYLPLKKRMIMMKKKEDLKRSFWRYALLLPFTLILAGFSYAGRNMNGSPVPYNEFQKVSPLSQNEKVYTKVDEPPRYIGGNEALMAFLSNNIKYPRQARKKGTEGTVFIQFIVEKDGKVSNIEVKRGIGDGCDQEGIRVVKLMKKWIPGKKEGKNVRTKFILPLKFVIKKNELPKDKKSAK